MATTYGLWELKHNGSGNWKLLYKQLLYMELTTPKEKDIVEFLIKKQGVATLQDASSWEITRSDLEGFKQKIISSFMFDALKIDRATGRLTFAKENVPRPETQAQQKSAPQKPKNSPKSSKQYFASAAENPVWVYIEDQKAGLETITFRGDDITLEDADAYEILTSGIKAGAKGLSLEVAMSEFQTNRAETIEIIDALVEDLRSVPVTGDKRNRNNRPQQYVVYSRSQETLFVCNSVKQAQVIRDADQRLDLGAESVVDTAPQ